MDVSTVLGYVFSLALNVFGVGFRLLLTVLLWLSHNYPGALNAIFAIAGIYTAYKMGRRFVSIWIGFVVMALKFFAINATLIALVLLYLRGPDRLLNHDIPMVLLWWTTSQSQFSNVARAGSFLASIPRHTDGDANPVSDEEVVDYLEQVRDRMENPDEVSFDDIQDMVNQGWHYVQHADIDWRDVGSNLYQQWAARNA